MWMKERGNGLNIPDAVTDRSVITGRDKLIMVSS